MKQKSVPGRAPADQVIKDIRRQTRRHYSAEEKIGIVLEGLRGSGRARRRQKHRLSHFRAGRAAAVDGRMFPVSTHETN